MTFLAPLFLLGALAVALPILFHLIRRTSRETVRFSSLMFLLPSPPRITRRSRLEHILLLLLRCGVICLLALAFARPYMKRPLFDPPADASAGKTVLLLDISASMRRDDLWSAAVARAGEVLQGMPPAGEFAAFTFDQTITPLVSFDEWNRTQLEERARLVRERIAALKPAWKAGHLDLALIQAAEEFQSSEARQPGKQRIVVVSDFQEGSHLDRLQSYEWPANVEVRIESLKPKQTGNAGLHLVSERDAGPPGSSAPKVRITNARDSNTEQFDIAWANAAARSGSNGTARAYVPAGQTRVFQAPPLPTNSHSATLSLLGDRVAFDDRAFWADPLPTEVRILFPTADTGNDPAKPLYYLRRALQQTQRQKMNLLTGEEALRALADTNDARGDVLAVVTHDVNAEVARDLGKWIRGGRTALFVIHNPSMAAVLEQVTGHKPIASEEAPATTYAMLGQIDFEHPIFLPFADARYSDFTKIHFWKHRRFSADALPQSRIVARFDDANPALIEAPLAKGKVLILTSGWDPAESQLALSSKFVPLLYSILEYSGAPRPTGAQFLVGDPVPLPASSSREQTACSVRLPDGQHVETRLGETFTQTDTPGLYTVTSLQRTQYFAVNLAPTESRTAPLPPEDLQRLGVPLVSTFKPSAERTEQRRRELHHLELESRQKLWRWLIIVVLVILVVETWFAARLTRRASIQVMQA